MRKVDDLVDRIVKVYENFGPFGQSAVDITGSGVINTILRPNTTANDIAREFSGAIGSTAATIIAFPLVSAAAAVNPTAAAALLVIVDDSGDKAGKLVYDVLYLGADGLVRGAQDLGEELFQRNLGDARLYWRRHTQNEDGSVKITSRYRDSSGMSQTYVVTRNLFGQVVGGNPDFPESGRDGPVSATEAIRLRNSVGVEAYTPRKVAFLGRGGRWYAVDVTSRQLFAVDQDRGLVAGKLESDQETLDAVLGAAEDQEIVPSREELTEEFIREQGSGARVTRHKDGSIEFLWSSESAVGTYYRYQLWNKDRKKVKEHSWQSVDGLGGRSSLTPGPGRHDQEATQRLAQRARRRSGLQEGIRQPSPVDRYDPASPAFDLAAWTDRLVANHRASLRAEAPQPRNGEMRNEGRLLLTSAKAVGGERSRYLTVPEVKKERPTYAQVLKALGTHFDAEAKRARNADERMAVGKRFVTALSAARFKERERAREAAWAEATEADPLLAPKLADNLVTARKALDRFGDRELYHFLDDSGLANHPAVIRLFTRVGEATGEDRFVRLDSTGLALSEFVKGAQGQVS